MTMITGGAFQGKKNFAKRRFNIAENEILDGGKCGINEVFSAKCVTDFHMFVRRLIDEKIDVLEFTKKLCEKNSDIIIIINEIGCGIIPIEKSERIWREQVGSAGCIIAENSSAVVRICCGIPTIIKGEI
ncbi:MAG: bifunctional adenosylcobinamide kinase/adenosylcobinamide-phosphate guanylyltransferase [Ruminococcus sp.]|nr:bifunctional adenosylcobinamide kinase/adenosylcobinamide-phosphate guanylyltransferase [Ruminococcus sp.]MCM1381359.1 bifunctional adenosylcobinamide kinase/adenosylcobinamide-phosphate guanylyltransferase [Muribaculaceae bacterium]MCM1480367.1 bifunctional adenosylcobinamide kinase/adenosylcobinamide-phosphate guanylyltransferase [Muribaculaceae bacterium]